MLLLDAHCHLFNLNVVYNKDTRAVLRSRLRQAMGLSWFLSFLASFLVDIAMSASQSGDPDFLYCSGAHRFRTSEFLYSREFDEHLPQVMPWGTRRPVRFLLRRYMRPEKAEATHGFLEFLSLGLRTRPVAVGLNLMAHLYKVQGSVGQGVECGCVPLMMDFYDRKEKDVDRSERQLECQVRGLMEVVALYPGLVLPFLSVSPKRGGQTMKLLSRHYENNAFCGVKIYPSMGYSRESLNDILLYCNDNCIPVLMHSNTGGFRRGSKWCQQSNPMPWRELLKDAYPDLRFCFGHFGGTDYFTATQNAYNPKLDCTTAWTQIISEMMTDKEYGDRIFADLSFHGGLLKDRSAYFARLDHLLADGDGKDHHPRNQILFGTDHWMLTSNEDVETYWRYFLDQYGLSPQGLRLLSGNTKRFLGLVLNKDGRYAPNMEHYIAQVQNMQRSNGPDHALRQAAWLTEALDRPEPTA